MISRGMRALGLAVLFAAFLLGVPGSAWAEKTDLVLREGTNFAAALSPADGSFVLDLQGTLWRLPPEGGRATTMTDSLGDDRLPHFSSDGTRLVFQSFRNGTWDIWVIDIGGADGANLTALTASRFDDREPVFSPDGMRVAFSSDRSGNYDIWVLELETRELTQLTTDGASDYMPAWSPDGDALVFVSDRPESRMALYQLELSAAGPAPSPVLLLAFEQAIASPAYSPDGTRIALRVLDIGVAGADAMGAAPISSRLVLVPTNGDGSGGVEDLDGPDDVFPFRVEWASASALVYTAAGQLWRQDLAAPGSALSAVPFEVPVTLDRPSYERRKVKIGDGTTAQVRGLVRPVLARDGSKIAFAALGDLWTVSPSGGVPIALTRDEYLDSDPFWSPDSRSIVYSSDRGGTMDLWVKDVDSPRSDTGRRLTMDIGAELAPAWSPDGTHIAYVDERARLHVLSVESGTNEVLTEARRGVSQPTWSSDSIHVALSVHVPLSTRFREGYNRILIVNTRTRASRILHEVDRSIGARDADGPVWSPDGTMLAFAMDGGLWILAVSADGTPSGAPRQIAGEAVDFPSWSSDSQWILFVTPTGLKRVGLDGGRPQRIELDLQYEIPAARGQLLLRDVKIIDGTGAPPREHQDVLIDGNRIERIGPTGRFVSEDLRTVEGNGRTLIPGLIEMHTHLSLPAWGSRHGKVWLAYGITSMRTPADSPYRVLEERESILSSRRVGPRVFFTGGTIDGDRIYYTGSHAIGDVEELAQEMQRAFDLEYDLIKTYVRLPDPLQKLVIEEAHRQGFYVTSHELYPAVAYGVDGIEHVAGTSRRGFSPKLTSLRRSYDDVIELVARSGVYYTPTVLIYGGWSLARAREPNLLDEDARFVALFPPWSRNRFLSASPPGDVDASSAAMAPIFSTVEALGERGARIIAGTDSPIIPYGFSLLLEIEQLSDAGLGPIEAIRSATGRAAEALGADDEIGTVEEGKIADLVLLAADPSEDIKNLRTTEIVIVNGRLLTVEQLLGRR